MTPAELLPYIVFTPGCIVLLLGFLWLVGVPVSEKFIARLTKGSYLVLSVAMAYVISQACRLVTLNVSLGEWFSVGSYHFPLCLHADHLSMPFAMLALVLAGIAATFSLRYVHRDPGFFRFFLLLHLFTQGALLVFLGGSLDLLLAGWELVGITAVMLVGFFQYRRDPVRNALRVFSTYRIADLNILIAILLVHYWFQSSTWEDLFIGDWTTHTLKVSGPGVSVIAVLMAFAASGKASQGPFGGWLARAMEGPTPSSAIFYGAISVHAGAYLLLRMSPMIHASPVATWLIILMGLGTALLGTLVHRTCTDAKTSLAYAAQTQLGLIFAEIAMGWTNLAVLHIIGHAILRMTQFLRAPSMLHDHHRVHSAAGGHLDAMGKHYERLLPRRLQLWLYHVAMARGFYDSITDRFIVLPMQRFAVWLGVLEPRPAKPKSLANL